MNAPNETTLPILLREDSDGVARLTLNRPGQFNSLSEELLTELQAALNDIAKDSTVRVVVIAGAGKAFCSGHDLKQMRANHGKAYMQKLFKQCGRMMMTLVEMPQPVIARVHGIATAAGCQLVAMCDLAVAAQEAKFAVSGINLGLFCSTPSVALGRAMGRKQAMEMLLTGEFIDAAEAQRRGLINRVVAARSARCRSEEAERFDHCQIRRGGGHGQADVLSADGNGPGRRLSAGIRDHGLQHDGRGRRRRHRCLHGKAQTGMEASLTR
jgi:enoyl-CoA hydratase/carnithine racemase